MNIGVSLPLMEPGWDRQRLLQWCRAVDQGPFSSLSLGERIAFPNPEFLTTLAACATVTERVELIATVMVLPLHQPLVAAKQLATIDLISQGRLSVGLGVGGREEDYRAAGSDLNRRRQAVLSEQVGIMRRVWTGERVDDSLGQPVGPLPVQSGGPRLLAGAMGPKAITAASQWADGVTGFSFGPNPAEIGHHIDLARQAWRDAGRPPPRLITSFWYGLGGQGRSQIQAHLRRYLNWLPQEQVEALLPHTGFAGDGSALVNQIRQLQSLGADEIILTPTTNDPAEPDRLAQALSSLW